MEMPVATPLGARGLASSSSAFICGPAARLTARPGKLD
jgi:hypothetical protein